MDSSKQLTTSIDKFTTTKSTIEQIINWTQKLLGFSDEEWKNLWNDKKNTSQLIAYMKSYITSLNIKNPYLSEKYYNMIDDYFPKPPQYKFQKTPQDLEELFWLKQS